MTFTIPTSPAALSRLTILVLASTYPRWAGDPEPAFVHELCKYLSLEHRVIVLCPHAPGALEKEMFDGVEVVRYRYAPRSWEILVNAGGIINNLRQKPLTALLLPGFIFFQFWGAVRLARLHRVDAIHAHWLIPQGLIAAVVGSLFSRRIPFVVTSHGADLYALRGWLMGLLKRFVAARANAITVVSGAMQSDIVRLKVQLAKVSIQPMGIDFESRFTPDPAVARSSNEILFVGRLVEKKGLSYLIDAMPAILAARPSACLKIVGFGPEEIPLRERVRRMRLSQVHFMGAVQQADLPTLYRRAAVFVAPFVRASNGDIEGLGLVVGEAIGCHCPVVAGDVPAVKDVIAEGEGRVVSPLDTAALANAIVEILENPKPALDSVTKARLRLMQQLSWPVVAAGYSKLLRKICGATNSIAVKR